MSSSGYGSSSFKNSTIYAVSTAVSLQTFCFLFTETWLCSPQWIFPHTHTHTHIWLSYLEFAEWCCSRVVSSGMWHCIAGLTGIYILKALWSFEVSGTTQPRYSEDLNLHLCDFSVLMKLSGSTECRIHQWPIYWPMLGAYMILPNGCSDFRGDFMSF
jgi:hypothetical protein